MACRLATGHHADAVFMYFEHIVDFLLTDSHAPSIMKEPLFEICRAADPKSRFSDRSQCDQIHVWPWFRFNRQSDISGFR
jgi:hypothetical protein